MTYLVPVLHLLLLHRVLVQLHQSAPVLLVTLRLQLDRSVRMTMSGTWEFQHLRALVRPLALQWSLYGPSSLLCLPLALQVS